MQTNFATTVVKPKLLYEKTFLLCSLWDLQSIVYQGLLSLNKIISQSTECLVKNAVFKLENNTVILA